MNDLGEIVSVITLAVVFIGGYVSIRERIAKMEVKIDLYWQSIAKDAARILHTPHPENARRDELIEKFVDGKISIDELKEFVNLLSNIIENKSREFGERTAASQLLQAIKQLYNT